LIVTEPTLPHTAFLPGVHLVEAPLEQMADTVCYYLSHEEERRRIVDQAYQLTTTELTMSKGIAQILERVIHVRQNAMLA
jgi:spore maturation protein CgeB